MVDALINKLRTLDVKMNIINDRLDVQAPKGVMDNLLMEEIKLHKDALIDFIKVYKSDTATNYCDITSVTTQKHYPLSSAQRRLWILSQFEEQSIAYNIPSQTVLGGSCDIESFKKAIDSVIERHEILRTVFREVENGDIRQFIIPHEELNFSIFQEDFSMFSDKVEKAQQYIAKDSVFQFDLENGPLLRAAIIKLSEDTFVFYYNMHHIISDGWSMKVLTNDILDYYEGYCSNILPRLMPLRIQYKDYAVWQLNQLESEKAKKQKEYWLAQFSGEIPVLDLPTQKKRPLLKTNNGRSLKAIISKESTAKLKKFCQENDGSLFMGLLSALNALFFRYTSQNEFILGSPTAGRDHIDLENQIGAYVNMIALKNNVKENDSFTELFATVRENTFKSYKHQQYPFDHLVEDLGLTRDTSRNPVFDAILILQNIDDASLTAEVQNVDKIVDLGEDVSKYDLCFTFQEVGEYISIDTTYNTDVYENDVLINFINHYKCIIEKLLEFPEKEIATLNYLSKDEEYKLLQTFNDTKVDSPPVKTIVELFEEQVDKTPHATAILFEDRQLSYSELNKLSNQFASYLIQEHTINQGDIIGTRLVRSEMYVVCLLGILKTGSCCSPIDIDISKAKLTNVVENTKIIVDIDILEGFLKKQDTYSKENLNIPYSLNDLAYIVYTSGSTGVPKGCMLEHRGIVNTIQDKVEVLDLNANSPLCHTSKMYFVGGIWSLWAPLLIGGKVVLTTLEELQDIPTLLEKALRHQVKVLEVIPSQLIALFSINSQSKLKGIEKLVLSGEKLTTSYVNKFFEINPTIEIVNAYGQTECSDITTNYIIRSKLEKGKILIGKPIRNTKIYILDKHNGLCPVGVVGEICTSGIGVSKGYLNQPELTAEKFIENPFNTEDGVLHKSGDLGRWLPDGNIEILGRRDHQVNIRGHRVELDEIESALLKFDLVKDVVVMAKELELGEISLVAYLTSKEKLNSSEIRRYLKERLQEYMIPSYFVELEAFPLTPNGKINKKILPDPKGIELSTGNEYVAPHSTEQKKLVAIIKNILKKDKISIKDSFYDIGGDSIKLIQLLFELRKDGYNIGPEHVLKATDIEAIAALLKDSEKEESTGDLQDESFVNCSLIKDNWNINDRIEVSKNQEFMMRDKASQVTLGPFLIPTSSKDELDTQFRSFLKNFPELHLQFLKEGTAIYQQQVALDKLKLAIDYKEFDLSDSALVIHEIENISKIKYNFFTGELIRLFMFKNSKNSDKSWLTVTMSHALVDLHTAIVLNESLKNFITRKELALNKERPSSFHFNKWQQEYLVSNEGKKARDFWVNYIKDSDSRNLELHKVTQLTRACLFEENEQDSIENPCVEQSIVFKKTKIKKLEKLSKQLRVPISGLFMAYHQVLLRECSADRMSMQMTLVNGREQVSSQIDSSRVLGVINNVLPIKLVPITSNLCKAVQLEYLNARQHQSIPYEMIREDIYAETSIDIDTYRKGYINVKQIDEQFNKKEFKGIVKNNLNLERKVHLDLHCIIKNNGIEIQLVSSQELYDKYKDSILDIRRLITTMLHKLSY